ncbi:hypothetical protein N0V85_007033 [Neurospora sp. IMI 360204]|nr:hypothetical protein N0V85_007033 [Neurospora sp. IMI 360204]
MMRRSHRKSRKGCLECKRRHIKCDETRPRCINCQTVERECSYPIPPGISTGSDDLSRSPADSLSVAATPPSSASASVASFSGYGGSTATTPIPVPGPEPGPFMPDVTPFPAAPNQDSESSPNVNMVHMELLYHYTTDIFLTFPPVGDTVRSLTMHHALREPYLMYQILALSARHLSVLRPHREAFYHHHAIQLQTHALTLFNSIDMAHFDACIENRVPLFLFSAVLGFHALCDTLSYRDAEFPATLTRFMGYLHLHRGIYGVMEGHMEEMKQSELKPIIEMGIRLYDTRGSGPECDDILRRLGERFSRIDDDDKETMNGLRQAVQYLQVIFDAMPSPARQVQMLLAWGTMLTKPVMGMLEEGKPEVLAVLAYYFVCLHLCRKVWISGDSGRFLLESLARYMAYLGPEWEEWIETPCRLLREADEMEARAGSGEFGRNTPTQPTNHHWLVYQDHHHHNVHQTQIHNLPTLLRLRLLEAARIAQIHLLAMQSNPLLHAQFPTRKSQYALECFLARDTQQKMGGPLQTATQNRDVEGIRVARLEGEREKMVGFIRWDYPPLPIGGKALGDDVVGEEGKGGDSEVQKAAEGEGDKKKKKLEEGEIKELEGCRREYLEEYARLAEEAKERSGFIKKRCWHLTFVCIDPKYQGRGAGSLLTRRLLELVDAQDEDEKLPVYLESTMEAVPMYERLRFEAVDGFEMEIPAPRMVSGEDEGKAEGDKMTYREVCMVYYPKGAK